MKDRIERFMILPFSMGCSSHSSVAVAEHNKKHKPPPADPPIKRREESEEYCSSFDHEDDKKVEASVIFASPKANSNNASDGIFRFMKSLKSFSHLFVGYRVGTGGTETKTEMEIGFPTNVKHVTHIGLDGTVTTSIGVGGEGLDNLHPLDVPSTTPSSFPFGRYPLAIV